MTHLGESLNRFCETDNAEPLLDAPDSGTNDPGTPGRPGTAVEEKLQSTRSELPTRTPVLTHRYNREG